MILVYTNKVTPRLKYIFDFIFKHILKVDYSFTNDKDQFLVNSGPKFSYSTLPLADEIHFSSLEILFETGIIQQEVTYHRWKNFQVFFRVKSGELTFDPFASSFFLVTRYEEYLPHGLDRHKRYNADDSTACLGGFLENPVINIWATEIKNILNSRYPNLTFPVIPFTFTPTIDIDNAYAYKYKGILRNIASFFVKLIKLQFSRVYRRAMVLLDLKHDPFDSYDKQYRVHKKYNVSPYYFVLLGDYGKYDKNLSHGNPKLISLIKELESHGHVGLHPSYNSNKYPEKIEIEKNRLEKIIGRSVSKSRQHYIKLDFPITYRTLIDAGIKEDYSMGYPTKVGYRASTCTPFYFYDLEKEKETSLKVFPFVVMDSTLKVYNRMRSKEVIPFIKPIVEEVKFYGGNFTFIFHNESIGDTRHWRNWGDMYEQVLKLVVSNQDV